MKKTSTIFKKPKKLSDEEIAKRDEEWRKEREKDVIGRLEILIRDFEIPGSIWGENNGYVALCDVELLRPVLSEWKALKAASDTVAAKEEIERWQERVQKLEYRLEQVRRIIK